MSEIVKALMLDDTGKEIANAIRNFGAPSDAQADKSIKDWLDRHPEATTSVQDKSLTVEKFADNSRLSIVNEYVTPRMYGAVCDGTTDDSWALQQAINSGKPVIINETLAIAGTVEVPDNSIITIDRGVVVKITANVDGFIIGNYVTIDGFGTIEVTISGYTKTCITLDATRYSVVKNISITGKSYSNAEGIGVAIVSQDKTITSRKTSSCYNRVDGANIANLEIGVLLRGDTTEGDITYNWSNNHYLNFQSSFCTNAVHIIKCNHNYIMVFGEGGKHKQSTRTIYPSAYDTEIYLNNSVMNEIHNNLVDTGNAGMNKYVVWYDKGSRDNSLVGAIFKENVFDAMGGNIILKKPICKNTPIPGVNNVLDDPSVTKTYESFGTATISRKKLFQYPALNDNRLSYTLGETMNIDNWEDNGVSLECNLNTVVHPRYLNISAVPSGAPYRLGIIISGSDFSEETTIPFGLVIDSIIDLSNYFGYDKLTSCRKIKFVFYGGFNYSNPAPTDKASITSIALTYNTDHYESRIDGFAGIRRTGGTMSGDLEFTIGGVCLLSPNGTKYRLAVADDGTLTSSKV